MGFEKRFAKPKFRKELELFDGTGSAGLFGGEELQTFFFMFRKIFKLLLLVKLFPGVFSVCFEDVEFSMVLEQLVE